MALLVLSAVPRKPQELIFTLMARARMCELMAQALRLPNSKNYFTIGLFSGLDALLDAPLSEVIERLGLGDDMVAALLERRGDGGRILKLALHYENGAWEELEQDQLSSEALIGAYLGGLNWARQAALVG